MATQTSTYFRDPTSGAFYSMGANSMTPVFTSDMSAIAGIKTGRIPVSDRPVVPVAPPKNPIQVSAGGRALPMDATSGAQMETKTPTTPTTVAKPADPYTAFSEQMLEILKSAQGSARGNREGLTAGKERLENQSINLSNPLSESPYKALFQGMSPEASLAAQRGTQAAAAPGVERIENIMSLNEKTLGDTTELIKAMSALPVAQQLKMTQDTVYNLAQAYPDAGIQPGDTLNTAQAKVSNSPSFKAKQVQYVIDPFTGQPTMIDKRDIGGYSPYEGGGGMGSGDLGAPAGGGNVQALQSWLVSKGYLTQEDMDTGPGTYGPRTRAAVTRFQQDAGVDTSDGGMGEFGPKTQAAATQQGFQGQTAQAPRTVAPGGKSGGTSDVSGLRPEYRAALKDLGNGVRFFDETLIDPKQLPFFQRASVQYGIPLVDSTAAGKLKDAAAAYSGSTEHVGMIKRLTGSVITAPANSFDLSKQKYTLELAEQQDKNPWMPVVITDSNIRQFVNARNSVLSLLTRALGEVGTLTNQDIQRIENALPGYGDDPETAGQKAANLESAIQNIFLGKVQGYVGGSDEDIQQGQMGGEVPAAQGGTVRVKSPDGQMGTIPAGNLEQALQQGYTRI